MFWGTGNEHLFYTPLVLVTVTAIGVRIAVVIRRESLRRAQDSLSKANVATREFLRKEWL